MALYKHASGILPDRQTDSHDSKGSTNSMNLVSLKVRFNVAHVSEASVHSQDFAAVNVRMLDKNQLRRYVAVSSSLQLSRMLTACLLQLLDKEQKVANVYLATLEANVRNRRHTCSSR